MTYNTLKNEIESYGFNIESHYFTRPWGVF